MEILDQVMGLLKEAPEMAIWVIVIIFAYKTIIVGSAYGLVRFCVGRLGDVIENIKEKNLEIAQAVENKQVNLISKIDEVTISNCQDDLLVQIKRLKGVSSEYGQYIHSSDVVWLRQAIDDKFAKEKY
jgi:hypothetical protein